MKTGVRIRAAAVAIAMASAMYAQIPRTPDGHPDLQGTYDLTTITPVERPRAVEHAGAEPEGVGPRTDFTLPFEAAYEVDLWGSVRNQVAENRYAAQASAAQVATALLSTQNQLAQTYFELRAVDEQRRILDTTLADFQASLYLVRTLFSQRPGFG